MIIFVTVGSTKFDELIETVTSQDFQRYLNDNNHQLIIQFGNSRINTTKHENYKFKPSIIEDIKKADLVISAGGAGTILEVLELQKPLIVTPNTTLQDNHQEELSEKLNEMGLLLSTTVNNLIHVLESQKPKKVKFRIDNGKKIIHSIVKKLIV